MMEGTTTIICPCCGKEIVIETVVITEHELEPNRDTIQEVCPPNYEFG